MLSHRMNVYMTHPIKLPSVPPRGGSVDLSKRGVRILYRKLDKEKGKRKINPILKTSIIIINLDILSLFVHLI